MKRQKLTVTKRDIFGKKLKKLRRENILPANIYGRGVKSVAVQLPYKEFEKVYKEARETGLIDVQVNGELKPSLIHNVQRDHLNNTILHTDFYQVNLKEKVKTMVPILITGIAQAVSDKLGLLLQPLSQVEIEALPEDLPEKIEVNVEHLAAVDDQITVESIKPPRGVTILTDPSQVVVKIGELVSKEAQEQAKAEVQAAEAAKAATVTPTAEGVKPEGAGAERPEEKPGESSKPVTATPKEQSKTEAKSQK